MTRQERIMAASTGKRADRLPFFHYWRHCQVGWAERECRNRGMGMCWNRPCYSERMHNVEVTEQWGTIRGNKAVRDAEGHILVKPNGRVIPENNSLLGNASPDWLAGITNRFSYKGFNLSVLFDMKWGGDVYSGGILKQTNFGIHAMTLRSCPRGAKRVTLRRQRTNHESPIPIAQPTEASVAVSIVSRRINHLLLRPIACEMPNSGKRRENAIRLTVTTTSANATATMVTIAASSSKACRVSFAIISFSVWSVCTSVWLV